MKDTTTSVLGLEIPVTEVPETLQEAIQAAGGEQKLLTDWLNYIRFHRTNTEARATVAERVEEITKIPRAVKKVKAPTKSNPDNVREEWDETEADYVKRALAESGNGAELTNKVLEGLTVKFSAQGAAREAGPRKVAQVYTKAAQDLINKGEDTVRTAIATLQGYGIQVQLGEDGKPTLETLAVALKANRERAEKEANAALGLA